MLASTEERPFTRKGWIFELKLDGYRLLASKRGNEAKLVTRNGNDYTEVFPEIARAIKAIPLDNFIVDGEIEASNPPPPGQAGRLESCDFIVVDEEGIVSNFQIVGFRTPRSQ